MPKLLFVLRLLFSFARRLKTAPLLKLKTSNSNASSNNAQALSLSRALSRPLLSLSFSTALIVQLSACSSLSEPAVTSTATATAVISATTNNRLPAMLNSAANITETDSDNQTIATRPADFVDLLALQPAIATELRYASSNNFTGAPVPGYRKPVCLLQLRAAQALVKLQNTLSAQGLRLKVFDCYRPQQAVNAFVLWSEQPAEPKLKAQYFPNLPKADLMGSYIARRSGHSRGSTLDLTLQQFSLGIWQDLDMGSAYDLFDPVSNTEHPGISAITARHRLQLKALMLNAGFVDYPLEWWHFRLSDEAYPETYFDFIVE